jgi:hypothetical protein
MRLPGCAPVITGFWWLSQKIPIGRTALSVEDSLLLRKMGHMFSSLLLLLKSALNVHKKGVVSAWNLGLSSR